MEISKGQHVSSHNNEAANSLQAIIMDHPFNPLAFSPIIMIVVTAICIHTWTFAPPSLVYSNLW